MADTKHASEIIVFSHWYKLLENLQASSLNFYSKVEQALQERKIPKLEVVRVTWPEGGWLSARREYLRLSRERLVFDICGASFGTGFFVSWRFGEKPLRLRFHLLVLFIVLAIVLLTRATVKEWTVIGGLILVLFPIFWFARRLIGQGLSDLDAVLMNLPVLGSFYERFIRRMTYYRVDLMLMYQEAVHAAVMQIVDEVTKAQGLTPLSEFERRPILQDIYRRQ